MPDGFQVDGRDLEHLARNLRRAATSARLEVDATLAAIGEEHAEAARQIVGGHSTTIPPTIRSEPFPGGVRLMAGGENAPLAVLYEKGNKKGGGRKGRDSKHRDSSGALSFRHPVFGNQNVWVDQPRYPFFSQARRMLRAKTTRTVVGAWRRALESSGINVREGS